MDKHFTAPTTYFLQEGRENLLACLKVAFQAAYEQRINRLVIFTARGEGVRLALESFCSQPEFGHIKLVAVTFPQGTPFTDAAENPILVEISSEDQRFFGERNVPIIRAHLPFDPIASLLKDRGRLGQDLSLVGEALKMFCGSMALCVQAIALACDAGAVDMGEHVIALTSDTAILAQAATTRRMLEEMTIREVLCKPVVLSVSRKELADNVNNTLLGTGPKILQEPNSRNSEGSS